jgi:hypothetical protein
MDAPDIGAKRCRVRDRFDEDLVQVGVDPGHRIFAGLRAAGPA